MPQSPRNRRQKTGVIRAGPGFRHSPGSHGKLRRGLFYAVATDAILADCRDLVEQHGLDVEATRQAIKAMLDEQPVPLRRAA